MRFTSFVFGNVDHDRARLERAIERSGNRCLGQFGEMELGGRRLAVLHGDDQRRLSEAERSGRYDLLCYGHTHKAEQHRCGTTLVVNPGALHRARTNTIAVVELEDLRCEIIPITSGGRAVIARRRSVKERTDNE